MFDLQEIIEYCKKENLELSDEKIKSIYESESIIGNQKQLSKVNRDKIWMGCLGDIFEYVYIWGNTEAQQEEIYSLCLELLNDTINNYDGKENFHEILNRKIIDKIQEKCYDLYDKDFLSETEATEILLDPASINYMLRNNGYEIDYENKLETKEILKIYKNVIKKLDEDSKKIMSLYFDKDGCQLLTCNEISKITGIDINKVTNTKNKVLKAVKNYACSK